MVKNEDSLSVARVNGKSVHSNADANHAATFNWHPPNTSFDGAYLPEKKKLVARNEDVIRESAMLQSGIRGHIDATVGDHYRMSYEADLASLSALGLTPLAADRLAEKTEECFETDWESHENYFDASGRMTGSEMVACGMYGHFRQGETIIVDKYLKGQRDKGNRPFATSNLLINPDRVLTPYHMIRESQIKAGFKQNRNGYSYAMYVLNRHPSETLMSFERNALNEFKQISRQARSGRNLWAHIFITEAADQTRGRPSIMANLKKVRMLDKFEDTMLMNAINRAAYAAVVESGDPQTAFEGLHANGPNLSPDKASQSIGEREAIMRSEIDMREGYYNNEDRLELNGSYIAHMLPGDKLNLMGLDGNVDYLEAYEAAFLRHLARGLNISYEELSGDYTKTNYSGARAGKTQTELGRRALAANVPGKQAAFMARNWLEEQFSIGRIPGIPGRTSRARMNYFLNNKEQLCKFKFHGPGTQHIDPTKGTEAAMNEMQMGALTLKDYVNTYGSTSHVRVLRQRARELRLAKELGLDLHEMLGFDGKPERQTSVTSPRRQQETNDE